MVTESLMNIAERSDSISSSWFMSATASSVPTVRKTTTLTKMMKRTSATTFGLKFRSTKISTKNDCRHNTKNISNKSPVSVAFCWCSSYYNNLWNKQKLKQNLPTLSVSLVPPPKTDHLRRMPAISSTRSTHGFVCSSSEYSVIQVKRRCTRLFSLPYSSVPVRNSESVFGERVDETIRESSMLTENPLASAAQYSHEKRDLQEPLDKTNHIAVIGSGAVGCYYGGRLWSLNHNKNSTNVKNDVWFYMRDAQHCAMVKESGLIVSSDIFGMDVNITPSEVRVFHDVRNVEVETTSTSSSTSFGTSNRPAFGGFDWIIVSIKSTGLKSLPEIIVPLLKPDNTTRIIAIMNGMIESDLIQYLKLHTGQTNRHQPQKNTVIHDELESNNLAGLNYDIHDYDDDENDEPLHCCQTLYGGMALLCSNRISPGRVHHSYGGQLTIGVACTRTTNHGVEDEDRIAIEELFGITNNNSCNIDVLYDPWLARGRWKKMLWNLPFNGISVAMGGLTIDKIVTDPNLRSLAYAIMNETVRIANADLQYLHERKYRSQRQQSNLTYYNNTDNKDYGLVNPYPEFVPLNESDTDPMMALSDGMGPYKPSTMLDLINRRSMEVRYMFEKPLERAMKAHNNVSAPHLRTIVAMIQAYQRLYNLY